MKKNILIILVLLFVFSGLGKYGKTNISFAADDVNVELHMGPLIEAIPGEDDLLVPVCISTDGPIVGVNILLSYDPTLITPDVVAPNMFFQYFDSDISVPGRITINLLTDLSPPPVIQPIEGDTIFAWISCAVTTRYIGYDLITNLTFFDDPLTPYPDNSVYLKSGDWLVYPELILTDGDILIICPLYGDLNLNGYAYEIGDAITFVNFLIGKTEFNKRQKANSDCNQDGIQGTISDLVYLLSVINGDIPTSANIIPPNINNTDVSMFTQNYGKKYASESDLTIGKVNVKSEVPLGGAYFIIRYDPELNEPIYVELNNDINPYEISWSASDGELKIAFYNWYNVESSFNSGDMFEIYFENKKENSEELFSIKHAEFSGVSGKLVDVEYSISFSGKTAIELPRNSYIELSAYPNPFNNQVSISYELPDTGNYKLVLYDILGRQIRSFLISSELSRDGVVIWDGKDNYGNEVTSGLYFVRIDGESNSKNLKLIMLK